MGFGAAVGGAVRLGAAVFTEGAGCARDAIDPSASHSRAGAGRVRARDRGRFVPARSPAQLSGSASEAGGAGGPDAVLDAARISHAGGPGCRGRTSARVASGFGGFERGVTGGRTGRDGWPPRTRGRRPVAGRSGSAGSRAHRDRARCRQGSDGTTR